MGILMPIIDVAHNAFSIVSIVHSRTHRSMQGGYSNVWTAVDTRNQRKVAVKVIRIREKNFKYVCCCCCCVWAVVHTVGLRSFRLLKKSPIIALFLIR